MKHIENVFMPVALRRPAAGLLAAEIVRVSLSALIHPLVSELFLLFAPLFINSCLPSWKWKVSLFYNRCWFVPGTSPVE